jgi:hypothetical protein
VQAGLEQFIPQALPVVDQTVVVQNLDRFKP